MSISAKKLTFVNEAQKSGTMRYNVVTSTLKCQIAAIITIYYFKNSMSLYEGTTLTNYCVGSFIPLLH